MFESKILSLKFWRLYSHFVHVHKLYYSIKMVANFLLWKSMSNLLIFFYVYRVGLQLNLPNLLPISSILQLIKKNLFHCKLNIPDNLQLLRLLVSFNWHSYALYLGLESSTWKCGRPHIDVCRSWHDQPWTKISSLNVQNYKSYY